MAVVCAIKGHDLGPLRMLAAQTARKRGGFRACGHEGAAVETCELAQLGRVPLRDALLVAERPCAAVHHLEHGVPHKRRVVPKEDGSKASSEID